MLRVQLDHGFDGFRTACLRALSGADELAAEDGAVPLLDRLLVAGDRGSLPPGSAARLPVADRDRLLAAIYRDLFGEDVEADATCPACGRAFELRFALGDVVDKRASRPPDGVEGPDALGRYRLGEILWRLPGTADIAEAALAGGASERRAALLKVCIVEGNAGGRGDAVEEAMAALGPTLDIDIDASCPHCGTASAMRFEIGAYLLRCIENERRFLLREVHRIARAYRWSCAEIMALPRSMRHELVRLIDADAAPARRALSLVG